MSIRKMFSIATHTHVNLLTSLQAPFPYKKVEITLCTRPIFGTLHFKIILTIKQISRMGDLGRIRHKKFTKLETLHCNSVHTALKVKHFKARSVSHNSKLCLRLEICLSSLLIFWANSDTNFCSGMWLCNIELKADE